MAKLKPPTATSGAKPADSTENNATKGTTPIGGEPIAQKANGAIDDESFAQSTRDIAALAYELWQERGCPVGDPEIDWYAAEILVKNARR